MQEKQRAWVFGASGLTGQAIVKSLRKAGIETCAHIRPNSSSYPHVAPDFEACGAEIHVLPWDSHAIGRAFERQPPQFVFLALGTTKARARADGEGYMEVDYGYTKLVIDKVLTEHPSSKLIYISAIPGGASAYFRVRTQIEAMLLESGANVLIARPSLIIGDRLDERPWERRAAWLMDGFLSGLRGLGLGSASDKFRSMTGETLGAGVVQLCLESSETVVAEVAEIRAASVRFGVTR